MSGLIYYTDKRRVLPILERTNTYIDTFNLTKADVSKEKINFMRPLINLKDENLSEKITEWRKSKNYNLAGDILSQSLISNKQEEVEDIKKYLLSTFPNDTVLKWLFKDREKNIKSNEERIEYNFKKLQLEPKDSLTWTDQAINYILLNDRDESLKCIEEALKINSNLGFILRNAARIFSLTGDNNRSIKILRNSEYYKYDPQILSAEIAFSQLDNRRTNGIEIANKLILDNKYKNKEKSELASTLATIEFIKGELRKSEKLFELSLLDPTKNSYAQYLWYKNDNEPLYKRKVFFDSNEIQTHLYLNEDNFQKSLKYAINWKDEEPYSLRPYRVASDLSGELLGEYDTAYEILKAGLESQKAIKADNFSHKDELILNNDLAYYLLKSNRVDEAENYLNLFLDVLNKSTKLDDSDCVNIATIGLFAYKLKNDELGRSLYRKSIKYFQDNKKFYLAGSAFLNFFDEEIKIITNLDSLQKLRRELDDLVPINAQNDLLFRKDKSIKLFNENVIRFQ